MPRRPRVPKLTGGMFGGQDGVGMVPYDPMSAPASGVEGMGMMGPVNPVGVVDGMGGDLTFGDRVAYHIENRTVVFYVVLVGIIGLVLLAIYFIYNRYVRKQDLLYLYKDGYVMKDAAEVIPKEKIPLSVEGNVATYFMWVNIRDYEYLFSEYKVIFIHGGENTNQFAVAFTPNINNLMIIWIKDGEGYELATVEDIPIKKWISIGLVINEYVLDVYINGRLEKTEKQDMVPMITDAPIQFSGDKNGYDGVLVGFRYFTKALPLPEIRSLHNSGPWGSNPFERIYYNYFGNRVQAVTYLEQGASSAVLSKPAGASGASGTATAGSGANTQQAQCPPPK
jgi:hypothetical protein